MPATTISAIEGLLGKDFDVAKNGQKGKMHRKGDPLWSTKAGFVRAEEDALIAENGRLSVHLHQKASVRPVMASFYINVRLAALESQKLAELLDRVRPCWPGHE